MVQPKKLLKDIDPIKVQQFKKSFDTSITKLLSEGEEGYDDSILRWSDKAIKKAGLVVQAINLDDIKKTVKFSSQSNLDFAVCCGKHSTSGSSSTEGGILLDMKNLNNVRVDNENKLVYVQGGALFGDVDKEAWKYGLAVPGGIVDHTGVSGLTLGGGFGHLTGRHGLSLDNVVGATIVTADGESKELSDTENNDLFWAIRGCGPNFGVIYEFIFKAHEQKDVFAGIVAFPAEKFDSVFEAFNVWIKNRGPDENAGIVFVRFPPENKPVIASLLFSNDPSEQVFRERFSAILKCEPMMESVGCMPFPKANTLAEDFATFGDRKGILNSPITNVNNLDTSIFRQVFDSLIKFTEENPAAGRTYIGLELQDYKKFCTIPSNSTAFNHREPFFHVVIVQRWLNEQDDKIVYDWAKSIQKLASSKNNKIVRYINFEDSTVLTNNDNNDNNNLKKDDENLLKILFGDNLLRLKELKRKYDPNVFFRKGAVIWP